MLMLLWLAAYFVGMVEVANSSSIEAEHASAGLGLDIGLGMNMPTWLVGVLVLNFMMFATHGKRWLKLLRADHGNKVEFRCCGV